MSLPLDLTWTHIEGLCEHIAGCCDTQDFKPDIIVGIARGGLIPAVMLSHIMDARKVKSFRLASYDDNAEQRAIISHDPLPSFSKDMKILIVDDICDTGETLKWVRQRYKMTQPHNDIRYACLTLKGYKCSREDWPEFYGWNYDEGPAWVTFPWEPPAKEIPF